MGGDGPKLPVASITGLSALLGAKTAFGQDSRTTAQGTGTQTITVGFEPKIIVIEAIYASTNGGKSFGSMDATTANCNFEYQNGGSPQRTFDGTKVITVNDNNASNSSKAASDGFTSTEFKLDWTVVDVNVNFLWIAIG
jgi:hypothetical protein